MKSRIYLFFKIYLFFIITFAIQKVLFMAVNYSEMSRFPFSEWLKVVWYGLPLDASTAGYLTVLPGLFLVLSCWVRSNIIAYILRWYSYIFFFIITFFLVADLGLYQFWGYHIDNTLFYYLLSPKIAFASVSVLFVLIGLMGGFAYLALLIWSFNKIVISNIYKLILCKNPAIASLTIFLITGALFLPIRGGVGVSTMNVGRVYFSQHLFLNHSAINIHFNMFASIASNKDFGKQYRFMEDKDAKALFEAMTKQPINQDSIPVLLNNTRPNIILFVMESFMNKMIEPLGGEDVAVNMKEFCKEGIVFKNFYANGNRTDKGLVAILSGYPAQPTTSIIKYPNKAQSLPSIPKALRNEGYSSIRFYYGGDADFFNMRSYLMGQGVDKIISQNEFPLESRLSKWGAADDKLIEYVLNELKQPRPQPFMDIVLTLSSHEPFDVPTNKFNHPYLNSVAFADSCLGVFVREFKKNPLWNNTLLIFVADHTMRYPDNMQNTDPERYQIPLILYGGAIKQHIEIERYASQIDLAAILLHQLGIDYSDFKFSKNALNPQSSEYTFFAYNEGFGCITPQSHTAYDHTSKAIVAGDPNSIEIQKSKAFVQCLYDDLGKR
jgi:phosphoglycerol transferase MdoB-like AlkP superfamily enzyme